MTTDTLAALCARLYATLTDQKPTLTDEFTGHLLDTACATLRPDEVAGYPDMLTVFVEVERDALAELIHTFGPGGVFEPHRSPLGVPYELVHSPAVLALCERLSTRPMALRAVWEETWESDSDLDDLSTAWGRL